MKYLAACLLLLTGCVGTIVKVPDKFTVIRICVLQKMEIPEITVNNMGTVKGYKNDGGQDMIGDLIALGVQTMLKQNRQLPAIAVDGDTGK